MTIQAPVSLEQVITTAELARRPSRAPDYESENRALAGVMEAMARTTNADEILQKLVETALDLCRAHSAGVSILEEEDGREVFRWRATAGRWSIYSGDLMPRESPCGTVLDRNVSLLMSYPERHYRYSQNITLPIAEALLVPIHVEDRAVGTIWIIAHDETRRFDAEDQRLMTSLGRFAANAYQVLRMERSAKELSNANRLLLERQQMEERFHLAVEAAPSGMILTNANGRIVMVNAQTERLFGYPRAELVGQSIEMLVPQRFRTGHAVLRRDYSAQPSARQMGVGRDLFAIRKDGSEVPVEIGLSPISTDQGPMILCSVIDITERKAAAETQDILIRELQHRTNNLLTVIQAIAHQSLRGDSLNEAKRKFEARLHALAAANHRLTQSNWKGLSLIKAVQAEMQPFTDRTAIEGPDVMLSPKNAQNFSLALHELATNAMKHGALSNAHGRVKIGWHVGANGDNRNVLRLQWEEHGGPTIKVAPERRKFGLSLLELVCRNVRFHYGEEGFKCTAELALDGVPVQSN